MRDRTSLQSSRVASFAAMSASRVSLTSHAASNPSLPLASWKMLLRIDGGSAEDDSDDA